MKKAITVIISALYVIAIVIIAFFGSEVRTESRTTHVEDIVLNNQTYVLPSGNTIYTVIENPNWANDKNNNVKYTITVRDYNYFYNSMGNSFQLDATVKPVEADHPTLEYSIISGDTYSSITQGGAFSFDNQLTASTSAQVKISSTDGSLVSIKVGIVAIVSI